MNETTMTSKPPLLQPRRLIGLALLAALIAPGLPQAHAQAAGSLNLYTARHYSSDDALYEKFTKATGIKVNVVSAGDEALLQRIKSEGAASPGDVLLLADASRLFAAEQDGLFQATPSKALENAIPANLRSGNLWFGLTTRARVLVIDPARVKPESVKTYADLASPALKGLVCTRTAAHPYMISLIASQAAHNGADKAEAWAKGVVANLARKPKGGDTDQIKAVASGECGVAVSNSYYYARLMRSTKPEDQAVVAKTKLVWPDQAGRGAHINVSGGGTLKNAPNKDNARKFLEFLASKEIQADFANGNNEWPVVAGVKTDNPALTSLGEFKRDPQAIADFAKQIRTAQQIADKTGWK
jgi:iron(III) transport system substrate-binding protein